MRPKIDGGVCIDRITTAIGRERKIKVYGLAREQRSSANDIVRQAIDLYLAKLEKKRQKNS